MVRQEHCSWELLEGVDIYYGHRAADVTFLRVSAHVFDHLHMACLCTWGKDRCEVWMERIAAEREEEIE